jgi:predicted Zn-dependent protease
VEGHRQKSEYEGQTFAKKLNEQIMPRGFDVYDDPNIQRLNGVDLNGFYRFDGEGVRAERALLVEDGRLRGFLMSRSPIAGFPSSNGHGRRESGYRAVARQANLIVDPARVTTQRSLKQALLAEVRRQHKPYGLRIGEVTGGYTMTERGNPQAFQIAPVMVYRVYPDGREELVRGVTLEGMPLSVMARVLAAGEDFTVFNGYCGAESGEVPTAAVSPSLLVRQIEVARQQKSNERPPLLAPPPAVASP